MAHRLRPLHVDGAGKAPVTGVGGWKASSCKEVTMGKTGRKRRARKKKGANHGKRPNA